MFTATVADKHVVRGRRSLSWHLVLAPWGPRTDATDVSVTRPLYDAVAVGGTVCVALRPGVLAIPWYRVAACRCRPCPS
jgi:hypothetical protein